MKILYIGDTAIEASCGTREHLGQPLETAWGFCYHKNADPRILALANFLGLDTREHRPHEAQLRWVHVGVWGGCVWLDFETEEEMMKFIKIANEVLFNK